MSNKPLEKEVKRKEKKRRKAHQHTCEAGAREQSACRGVRVPVLEGYARQRDGVGGGKAWVVVADSVGPTSPCPPSKDAGTTGRDGRERGIERGQEEEEQVVVREEEEEIEQEDE